MIRAIRDVPLAVGHTAPSFVLHEAGGSSSASPRGVPWVLAFARAWTPDQEPELGPIRVQLRGLGAAMIVIADAGVWWFDPDLEAERFAAPWSRLEVELATVAGRYGVAPGTDAAFVIDEAGVIRFAHAPAERLGVHLPTALRAATAAVMQARRQGRETGRVLTSREVAVHSLVAGFGMVAPAGRRRRPGTEPPLPPAPGGLELDLVLDVNGEPRPLRVDPRTTLLEALRDHLGLDGFERDCDHAECGACIVQADGRAINACLAFAVAVAAQGLRITTSEGVDAVQPFRRAS